MDQLVQIMQQRCSDIQILAKNNINNSNQYLNKQKQRCHKQNWVIKVLKSIKLFNSQLKTDIYYKSQTMMNMISTIKISKKQNLDDHFTQKLINIFIDFFNEICLIDQSIQYNPIKSIIRPNNSFIITDLLKSLIEIQRKNFRQIYIQNNSNDNEVKMYRKKLALDLMMNGEKQSAQNKQAQHENKYTRKTPYNPQNLLNKCLKQKYTNFIKNVDIKQLENKINEKFLEIKQKNSKNSYLIQKFRYKCLGATSKKNNDYDMLSLYTKEEILQIKQRIRLQAAQKQQKQQQNPQIQNQILGEQDKLLKQKSIKQLMKIQNLYSFQKKNNKYSTVQKWLPLTINKKPSKQHPWQIHLIKNKYKIKSSQIIQDPEISIIGIKQFLLQKLQQYLNQTRKQKNTARFYQIDMKTVFDKKIFLDFGRKKELELLEGDRVCLRKQLLFPSLKQNEQKQLNPSLITKKNPENIIRKSKSQEKFLPRFQRINYLPSSFVQQENQSQMPNSSLIQKQHSIYRTNKNGPLGGFKDHQTVLMSIKTPSIKIKLRKNSLEDVLNQKIMQRKLQIQEQNKLYQNRMKLLFGTQMQKNALIKSKYKKNKTSLLGISSSIAGMEHFLL